MFLVLNRGVSGFQRDKCTPREGEWVSLTGVFPRFSTVFLTLGPIINHISLRFVCVALTGHLKHVSFTYEVVIAFPVVLEGRDP